MFDRTGRRDFGGGLEGLLFSNDVLLNDHGARDGDEHQVHDHRYPKRGAGGDAAER
jgi:hypothetical protein